MEQLERQTDGYLVGAIVNGDEDAVRVLLSRYDRPLRALLRRILGAPADLDDAMQETWIRVVRSAHRYDPTQRFSGWLFAIAWNVARRRWTKTELVDASAEVPEVAAHGADSEQAYLAAERARHLREHVAKLPDGLAQAILLRYFEELSEREVAERLGIPLGTVKSRLHNALRKLAGAFEGGMS